MSATQARHILLAGCGSLGSAIGLALSSRHQVWGLRRRADRIPAPIQPIAGDLQDPDSFRAQLPSRLDAVIYCLTPATMDDAGYQAAFVTGLDNLLRELEGGSERPQLFFISSTSVYHQNDDSWVDEDSPTRPDRFSGQRLLEGEARLQASPLPGTVVRFSGIYGPGRTRFIDGVRSGRIGVNSSSAYTNRIHEADCVGVIEHLLARALAGESLAPCYLASDCEPTPLDEVVAWIRDQVPCAPLQSGQAPQRRGGSKRCNNARLLASGYVMRYPSFRDGYREILATGSAEPLA